MKKQIVLSLALLTASGTLLSNETQLPRKSIGCLVADIASWTAKKASENYDYYWTHASAKAAALAAQQAAEQQALAELIARQQADQLEADLAALAIAQANAPWYTKAATFIGENKYAVGGVTAVAFAGLCAYGIYKYMKSTPTMRSLKK